MSITPFTKDQRPTMAAFNERFAQVLTDATAGKYTKDATLGNLPVGSTVKLNVNGTATDFLVVHQGLPSSMYDSSCDGTWLLMKDCYESRQWHSSNVNDYANSTIHNYMNSTFLGLFDSDIQSQIKQVKIPYRPGSGTSTTINSGANGLSAKIFLLAGYEVGFNQSITNQYMPIDGAKLNYFELGDTSGTTARTKRIASLNGSTAMWWLRTPVNNAATVAWRVEEDGHADANARASSTNISVRPALVLPSTLYYYDDAIHTDAPDLSTIIPDDLFSLLSSATLYKGGGLTDVLGNALTVGAQIQTGSYVGTGTYGASNPCSLTFDFEPVLFVLLGATASTGRLFDASGGYGFTQQANVVLCSQLTTGYVQYMGPSSYTDTASSYGKMSSDGLTMFWYSTNSSYSQYNDSNRTYHWLAIG